MKAGNPKKYEGLEINKNSADLLRCYPKGFRKFCNGVGSKSTYINRLIWHFIPNTIWGLDITPASDLHDVGYSFPYIFNSRQEALEYKAEIDSEFLNNMMILINRKEKKGNFASEILAQARRNRAQLYYIAVSKLGKDSFLKNKINVKL
jgi:hypothetical protein